MDGLPELPAKMRNLVTLAGVEWNGSQCWCWHGAHRIHDGRPVLGKEYVYRILYRELRGALPNGKGNVLHHGCHRVWCVNPWHGESLNQSAHMREHGLGGDWGQREKATCPHGHAYDEANTYWYSRSDGSLERHCRACAKLTTRGRRFLKKIFGTCSGSGQGASVG